MPKWAQVRGWLYAKRWMVIVAAIALLVDRASKIGALQLLPGKPVVIAKYFWLNYVENTGAAFGIFQNGNGFLIVVMLAVLGYIVFSWKDIARQGRLAQWGAVLIVTGALGNLYDRVRLGFVVDFLDFRVWPVFNVADSLITIGAVLLGISLICRQEKK